MTLRDLFDAGVPHAPGVAATWGEAVSDAVDVSGMVILETATGVWSADAPVRAAGERPIEFRSWTDPADPTDGIATPANINDGDVWRQLDPPP